MSDNDNFLARWSRRKRDAAPDTRRHPKPEGDDGGVGSEASVTSLSSGEARPQFDPESLPPIDSIGAGSDIRAFLEAGVPADLTRAALRRVWQSDPKIRDFIGLSENSWDFNAPGAMAGFGPIDKEEVGRLLTELLGEPGAKAAAAHSSTMQSQADRAAARAIEPGPVEEIQSIPGSTGPTPAVDQLRLVTTDTSDDVTHRPKAPAVSQHEPASRDHRPPRGHGGALPK